VDKFIDELRADDLCLIISCELGDESAWEDLVAGFDATVRSSARKIAQNHEDADDLTGSIWAELYGLRQDAEGNKRSKLAYYSGRGSLGGWLRAVVSQLAIDQYRKQAKYVQVEDGREFENLAEEAAARTGGDNLVSHAEDPEHILSEKMAASDLSRAFSAAIERLSDEDKVILKLYYFDGLKLKDIAETFGYHEATASRKLARLHGEIRKTVETSLRKQHGWSEGEVKRHLSETASKAGLSVEKLFAILVLVAVMQDFCL
ncbi:MAG: sigma-70 family RNA polymerase sigma factor, partial [Acidobacteriota bacterium]